MYLYLFLLNQIPNNTQNIGIISEILSIQLIPKRKLNKYVKSSSKPVAGKFVAEYNPFKFCSTNKLSSTFIFDERQNKRPSLPP